MSSDVTRVWQFTDALRTAIDHVIEGEVWDKSNTRFMNLDLGIQGVNLAQPDLGLLIATT